MCDVNLCVKVGTGVTIADAGKRREMHWEIIISKRPSLLTVMYGIW